MSSVPPVPFAAVLRAFAVLLGCWLAVACPVIAASPNAASTTGSASAASTIPANPNLRLLGVGDGLPSSFVEGVADDSAGYIWLATRDGLARLDGIEVRVWRHIPGKPASLPANYIGVIHVDDRDRVWVAPEASGLCMLDGERAGFRCWSSATDPAMGSDDVWAINSIGDTVWFGTFGGGLHRLDADGAITRFMPREGDPRSLPSDTVLSLTVDARGRLWVGTTAGLARWTGHDFQRVALPGATPAPLVYSISPEAGSLWIGSRAGLFRLWPDADADARWSQPDWAPMFEHPNAVFSVIAEPDGSRWLSSQRNLWRVEAGGIPYPVRTGAQGPAGVIYQMLRQDNGAMWIPAPGVGIGYLRPDWRRIAEFSRERGGLSNDMYRGAVPARDGGFWLLSDRDRVERLDMRGQTHSLSEALLEQMKGMRPRSAIEDAHGRLWIGFTGSSGALLRIDPASGEFRRWDASSAENPTLHGQLTLLAIAPDDTLWTCNAGGGVQQRELDSGRVLRTILPGPRQGLGVGDLEDMAFDRDGALWIADGEGLSRWDAAAQRFRPVAGIPRGDRVFAFAFDGGSALWLQRLSGLYRYQRLGERWLPAAHVGVDEGIPAVEGSELAVDAAGRVWLPSLRGLFRWDPQQRRLRRFGLPDGLSSQEFVDRGMSLDDNGVLAAALADGGVVLLDTRAADPSPSTPALFWDRVEVRRGGQWVALDHDAATLQPDDRELRVNLRLLAFDDPSANRYFTRLEGYDSGWVAHDGSGERVFAGLAPGDYTLHARALDAAGNAAIEQVLHFSVLPPWWRTPWALAGALALVALLGWWAADAYRDRLKRRHALQRAAHEREVAQQASLAKTRFLATLGHEVRTPMTGVLGMSELLLGTRMDTQQRGYTQAIRHAGEHLLRLVNDALDLARIESGKLELDHAPFDLHALIDEASALMAPLARDRGLAFVVEMPDDVPRGVRGDGKRVCQILLNLLGNAIKFTERGSVTVRVARDGDDTIRFEVADTGPGLNEEQKQRLFRRFEQAEGARTAARYGGSGLGLAICQELSAAMGGRIEVESAPDAGVRFIVRLPMPPAELPTEAVDAPAPPTAPSMALLLVEDDATVAEVIAGLLRARGHRVTHVAHGLAALAEVATARFDAALLDLDLPGMDGLALARQLRVQGFDTPLIAITARADADAEPQAIAAGFDRFLRKPMTSDMLADVLAPPQSTAEPA